MKKTLINSDKLRVHKLNVRIVSDIMGNNKEARFIRRKMDANTISP